MRIVKTRYKGLFIAAIYAVAVGGAVLFNRLDTTGVSALCLGGVAIALRILAVRIFRVPEEDIAAPRPWWRMTGRPTAGFWLAALNALGAVSLVVTAVLPPPTVTRAEALVRAPAIVVVNVLINVAWAVLYFRSSLRLARIDGPAVDYPMETGR